MRNRIIAIAGETWQVAPSGFVTQSDRDEFGLLFVRGEGTGRTVRLTRYSPQGTSSRERSLAALSDAQLIISARPALETRAELPRRAFNPFERTDTPLSSAQSVAVRSIAKLVTVCGFNG